MRVITRDWFGISRSDTFKIIPLGDIHLGAKACDEEKFRRVVQEIKEADENTYWVGLGDYADFITVKDPRFNAGGLAEWVYNPKALSDIARTQKDRFLDEIAPIADRCLGLIAGNHETAIHRHYERDIYSDIVNGIKDIAGWDAERKLSFGYAGWLYLRFYRHDNKRRQGHYITISLHHGFVGGRLKGAKALNMQRWLWSHNCDLAIFGHSHNTDIQTESVRAIDRNANLTNHVKLGCYAGTFLKGAIEESSTYSEIKGYFPQPTGGVIITLQPGATKHEDRIAISTRGLS